MFAHTLPCDRCGGRELELPTPCIRRRQVGVSVIVRSRLQTSLLMKGCALIQESDDPWPRIVTFAARIVSWLYHSPRRYNRATAGRTPRPLAHPQHLPRRARSVRSCAHAVALEPAAPARAGLPYARCTQRRTGAAAAALPAHKHSSTQANCSMRISARVTGLRRAAHAARVHVCDHACDPARVCCESHVVHVQVLRVRMRVRAVHGLHRACQHARTFRIFASFVPCGGRTWRHGGYSSGLGLGLGLGTLWNVGGGGYPARRPGLSCSCTCQALGTPSCATSTN